MEARTIVTSHPDVACDVCERRLLRGEQPDVFVTAGERRTVCELCVPRALAEGWLRESEGGAVSLPPLRTRRGRGLLARLRSARAEHAASPPPREPASGPEQQESAPFDFLSATAHATAPGEAPAVEASPGEQAAGGGAHARADATPPSELEQALAVFNASEYPRRVAGVARSLGAPEVCVHCAEHARSVVVIVVAWELCWYRYEVDLDEVELEARLTAQGSELSELAREDRDANSLASDSGSLSLAAG